MFFNISRASRGERQQEEYREMPLNENMPCSMDQSAKLVEKEELMKMNVFNFTSHTSLLNILLRIFSSKTFFL